MFRRILVAGCGVLLAGGLALADFTYEQTSKITGGALMGMVKVMGAFSKQMREPMKSTTIVTGDRMATITQQGTFVIDLSRETMTEINHQKKQYAVVTFAEMAEALKNLDSSIKNQEGQEYRDVTIRAKVETPGDTRDVSGVTAKHAILKMEFEGTNKEGQKAVFMTMISDMWMAPEVAGYAEVKNFHQRMAQKLSWTPGSGMLSAMAPGSSKGMAEMAKELSKLEGVPVLQVVKMMFGSPEQVEAMAKAQQEKQAQGEQQQQEPKETNIQVEKPTSVRGALGGIGGRLGGFGRRRAEQRQQEQQEQAASGQGSGSPGSLMEMTIETTGFSQGSADASKLEVPAGYKQVESETVKAMKRR
jgi:hypothetical protein